MKKYFLTMAVMAIFIIGFAASDEDSSSSTDSEVKTVEERKKNPIEKFVGTYVVYDGNTSGNEMFVTDDGRLFYKYGDDAIKCGNINVISEDAFNVFLGKDLYSVDINIHSYKNGEPYNHRYNIPAMKTIIFDLSEKKLFIDEEEYKNRDYSSPEYYNFRFTKK